MKKIQIISENPNFTAGDVGSFNDLADYVMPHPLMPDGLPGKVFLSEALKTTGVEVSFQMLPPRMEMPFFHQHTQNEELYIFLKGEGDFQVDDVCFPVKEGSVVRIAPQGNRSWRNGSDSPMVFIVIQTKKGSLEKFVISDGTVTEGVAKWK